MDLQKLLHTTADAFTVGRAFGPPYERDDCVIIPVAWVAGGTGAGGAGSSEGAERSNDHGVTNGGGIANGGGGTGGIVWPLGVYVVKDGNVRWAPALDTTRVTLAGLALIRAVIKLRGRRQKA
jgi:uncharacterized spore protein YtfJ